MRIVPRYDVQWSRPVFRAPSLPTPSQIYAELPFTAFRGLSGKSSLRAAGGA